MIYCTWKSVDTVFGCASFPEACIGRKLTAFGVVFLRLRCDLSSICSTFLLISHAYHKDPNDNSLQWAFALTFREFRKDQIANFIAVSRCQQSRCIYKAMQILYAIHNFYLYFKLQE
jgi:hypothetical protein